MKPIQQVILSKVKMLIEKQKLADSIEHSTTKGVLRETYLKEFIIDIIPREYEVTTGFITSHNQEKLSPQIDLIVTDKSKTPKFILDNNNSIVPFESAYMLVEVKTTITTNVLDQLKTQREFLKECNKPVFYKDYILQDFDKIQSSTGIEFQCNSNIFDLPPFWLVGFESDVSEKKLKEMLVDIEGITGIWLVDKYGLYVENQSIVKKEGEESSLYSIDRVLTLLAIFQNQRKGYMMNWQKYLL